MSHDLAVPHRGRRTATPLGKALQRAISGRVPRCLNIVLRCGDPPLRSWHLL